MIKIKLKQLEDCFNDMCDEMFDQICKKNLNVQQIRSRFTSISLGLRKEHDSFLQEHVQNLSKEATFSDLWFKLGRYINFLNCTLLESIVHKFGDREIKNRMDIYLKSLKDFRNKTRLCDFAKCRQVFSRKASEQNLQHFISAKLKQEWESCTLENLEDLKWDIIENFHLPPFALILNKTEFGCMKVTWAVPEEVASSLRVDLENTSDSSREFCKKHGITSITIDGKECRYSPTKKYEAFLKDLYSRNEGKNLSPFKLAGIEKKKIDRSKMDSFTRSTLRSDRDNVTYTKYQMTEDKVAESTHETKWRKPRLVLIEGAPGVGKTTFSEQFCFKWSQAQRLNDHTLLVLLPLRDNRVRSAKSISDLFHHPQLQGAIAQKVESSQGEGVVLWLEAWDELEQRMREESSIFLDLVHGRKLPKATIIITSRPWATKPIVESTSIQLDQHIELITTPTLELSRVLREERVHPDIRSKFLDYVNFYPAIKAAMHTPVTANIVTDVFKWSQEMESTPPTTVTRLYTTYTSKLLMQHFSSHKAHGKQSSKIGSLEDLPPDMHQQLLALSKLAWEGIMKQQLTFSSADIGGVTLGLMESVKELYRGQDAELSYHFIHLMLQEFLAAYHITQLPLHTQQQLIREHIKIGHLSVMMKFYFGLSKFNTFTSEMVGEHISDRRSAAAYHWMYEAGDTEAVAFGRSLHVRSSYEWNPLDYYVLGHCIAHSQCKWKLDFSHSYMGREEMEVLSKGMMNMPEKREAPWEGEIETSDFSNSDLDFDSIEHFVNIPHPILEKLILLKFISNKLDNTCLNNLSKAIPFLTSLKELILSQNCTIGEGGAVKLIKTLFQYKTPLKRLRLDRTNIGEEDCASLTDLIANSELEELNVHGNSLSSNSVTSIMKGLLQNSTITKLDMSFSYFSEDNWKSLSSQLQRLECVLQDLSIAGCCITSEGAVQLAAGLATNKSLTRVILCENPCETALVGDALKTNSVLTYLNIAKCNITSEGAVLLADGLATNKSLTSLHLSGNPIGDIGAASIGDALKTNSVLKVIDIYDCKITSQGCIHIAEGLSNNSTLQELWMTRNEIGIDGAKAISAMLEKNTSLQQLHLDKDNSIEEGVDVILSSLKRNTSLTKLYLSGRYKRPAGLRVEWF